ncbi:piggyBac transposable element-derived protein 4-like [Acanthaster planci]|uniref:PiggyBac transposable element-derived protein 4-like n=1 Tax=Acanthaster planci TaxID=133434 RepID=A0A8B7Z102_ACAPL|nr:piggyBac transposable element-derived protein 4-like [Acanthaster planci]
MNLVGTIKGNRREVPKEMRKENTRNRPAKSAEFVFNNISTLVSYVPKPKKNILLLSSMHRDKATHPTTKKPDIITYYNATKAGVDTVDQMCSLYNCARITKRWPMVVFYHLLNCAVINSFVIYLQVNPDLRGEERTRHIFIHLLIRGLINPQIATRLKQPQRLRTTVMNAMEGLGFNVAYPAVAPAAPQELPPQRRCAFCPTGKRKRTRRRCCECDKFACTQHSASEITTSVTCIECLSAE